MTSERLLAYQCKSHQRSFAMLSERNMKIKTIKKNEYFKACRKSEKRWPPTLQVVNSFLTPRGPHIHSCMNRIKYNTWTMNNR